MNSSVVEIRGAVANKSGAMEQRPLKNGRNSKSHTSRSNLFNINFSLAVIACVLLSSCATMQKKTYSVTTVDITHTGVIQKPVIADLIVGQTKVYGKASFDNKNEAVKNALATVNADVLIEPNFTYTSDMASGYVSEVEVSGFPATYKNFRTIEDSDTTWLKNTRDVYQAKVYDTTKKQTAQPTVEQKSKKGLIWGSIGGGIAFALILLGALL
jgi:hypothetical protein